MAFQPNQLNWAALAALASGDNPGEQLGNANNVMANQQVQAQEMQQVNQTRAALLKQYPQYANEINAADGPTLGRMLGVTWQQRLAAEQPKQPDFQFMNVGDRLIRADKTSGNIQELGDYSQAKLPPIAEEYNWAVSQGFKGTAQDYQAYKAGLNKSGLMVEQGPDGFRLVQGNINGMPPKLTEAQSKDVNFLGRAKKAEEALAPVETELTSFAQKRMTGLPYDIGNYLTTPQYQQAQQAGREILAIILRKDTGAAVTPQEFETYSKIYLPQPGDDAATIRAKKESREAAIKGIQQGLGPLAPQDDAQTPDNGVVPYTDFFK